MGERTRSQLVAALIGLVVLLVGLLGFVPGVTTHYGRLGFAGHGSDAKLFVLFRTSILLNLVHVGLGLAGVVLARTATGARRYLLAGGIAFLLLWLLALVGAGGWVPLSLADNWLHLTLGIVLLAVGAVADRGAAPAPEPA